MVSTAMPDAATAHIDIAEFLRPGDTVVWGQAGAEPIALIDALLAGRHRVGGRFRVFAGSPSGKGCLLPEHADCIDLIGYCGSGANQALIRSGGLDILPCHYSQLPDLLALARAEPTLARLGQDPEAAPALRALIASASDEASRDSAVALRALVRRVERKLYAA